MPRTKAFDPADAVDTAMHTFWTHGYAATTPQRLVDELGIGRGSLYGTFGSKAALFHRALDRYRERTTALVHAALGGPGTGAERLRAALDLVADTIAGRPDGCLLTNSAVELTHRDPQVADAVRTALDLQRQGFVDAVSAGARDGSLRSDLDPEAVATWLLATTNGLQVLARSDVDRERLPSVLDTAFAALLPA